MQSPFPIYIAANTPVGRQRVGRLGDGLIVAGLSPEQARRAWTEVKETAVACGGDASLLSLHVQAWLTFGTSQRDAEKRALSSQHLRRTTVESRRTDEDVLANYRASNLLGTPVEIVEQIKSFQAIGASHLGIVFVVDTMDELMADMEVFAAEVMQAFKTQ
ncbi:MAG TPA: LLM class flavin-dependent oxidoreductase [bacterium]|nr:LLM class flavin-dependent oxidoreductase [bacterium]